MKCLISKVKEAKRAILPRATISLHSKSALCGGNKNRPSSHSHNRRTGWGRAAKTREEKEPEWPRTSILHQDVRTQQRKGLLGTFSWPHRTAWLGHSQKKKKLGLPHQRFKRVLNGGAFPSPGIHKEVNSKKRTSNSRCAEPSSNVTCSLTPKSRHIHRIPFSAQEFPTFPPLQVPAALPQCTSRARVKSQSFRWEVLSTM